MIYLAPLEDDEGGMEIEPRPWEGEEGWKEGEEGGLDSH